MKKNENNYSVLITTSGKGAGLGELIKYTNKTLLRVGHKPAISYIIEAYPKSAEFIVTLGYYGNHVRNFLTLAYPKHKFIFVNVDRFEGEGSSLGYSMIKASKYLQKPFIYHASDTIITDNIPKPTHNWIGGYNGIGSSNYTSFNVLNGKIQKILEKGIIDPDFLHIGLVGIYDYKIFWKELHSLLHADTYGGGLSDYHVLNGMIDDKIDFKIKEFENWYDVGNIESLKKTREKINDTFHILDKPEEALFMVNGNVIKFFANNDFITKRVLRAKYLSDIVPQIKDVKENYYTYSFVEGTLYSQVANPANFTYFLDWTEEHLWKETNETTPEKFRDICREFYYTKTRKRIKDFIQSRGIDDTVNYINDEKVPDIQTILKNIDFDYLINSLQTSYHGDFILDNILMTKNGFCLIDWRQDFGGLINSGDKYYDLAKLNHNLTVNHGVVNDNLFEIEITGNNVRCDIYRLERLVRCQELYWKYLEDKRYDLRKIKILTGLIWLNMSPLHHHPFDLFLFYFGKYNTWRALHEK